MDKYINIYSWLNTTKVDWHVRQIRIHIKDADCSIYNIYLNVNIIYNDIPVNSSQESSRSTTVTAGLRTKGRPKGTSDDMTKKPKFSIRMQLRKQLEDLIARRRGIILT